MTSEPDNRPRGRPPTIDLTATEIETEKPVQDAEGDTLAEDRAKAHSAPGQRVGWSFAGAMTPLAIGAGCGAIVVAALGFGLWSAGLSPSRHAAPVSSSIAPAANAEATNGAAEREIAAKLDKIQAELQAQHSENPSASRLAAVEAQTKSLVDSLAALNRQLDGIATTAQGAMERANAAAESAQGAAQGAVKQSDFDALAKRIAALEDSVKALSAAGAQLAPLADDRAARAALAAEALRANVERGAPFSAELAAIKSFDADPRAIAALEPFAADGVPTTAALAHELSLLIPSLAQAAGTPVQSGSFLNRLESHAKGLVRITTTNAAVGNDPSAVIARLDAHAARADIAAALAETDHLPQPAQKLAEPWVQKAKARDAAIAASRRIAADTLAGLTSSRNPNPQ